MPEDNLRSEHYLVTVAAGGAPEETRIEVPSSGQVLAGRITDKNTGEALAGIQVHALQFGAGGYNGASGADGRYQILGLTAGSWLVNVDNNNPVLVEDNVEAMESVSIEAGKSSTYDIEIDRGEPITGVTVDANGAPVPEAMVSAELYLPGGDEPRCWFKSDRSGAFTVWGAHPGDHVAVKASKDELGSFIAVVQPKAGEALERITLTLLPKVTVSGRFVDEQGRPVEAQFWSRPYDPNIPGGWGGQTERATTFTAEFAPGTYELQGRARGMDFSPREAAQRIEVGSTPLADIVIEVATVDPNAGAHTFAGRVVDESGQPLRKCRLNMEGDSRDTMGSRQQTKTDNTGRFEIAGLLDGTYRVHAYPEDDQYEEFAGYEKINPVDTRDAIIVVRRRAALRGRVVDGQTGKPITQFEVECGEFSDRDDEYRWGPMAPNIASDNGEFEIPARLDMNWYLRVSAAGYAPQRITGAALASGEKAPIAEFKLLPGRIARGTVVDSEGNPVPRAQVYLQRGFADGPMTTGRAVTESDSEGRFTVASIAADEEFVYLWKRDFAASRAPISEDIQAVLTKGGVVEGRVTIGGAVPQEEFSVHAQIPDTHFAVSAILSAGGDYRFDTLMDLPYHIQVTLGERTGKRTYFPVVDKIEPRHDHVLTYDIDVPRGDAVVEGIVLDHGAPVAGAQLRCLNAPASTHLTTDETGAYRFENLVPGPVKIALYLPSDPSAKGDPYVTVLDAEIAAGDSIQHDIETHR